MPFYIRCSLIFATAFALAAVGTSAVAQTILDNEHVDIGIAYEDDAWDLHVHDETHDIEYEPDDALLYVGQLDPPPTQGAGSEWDFIGAGAGNEYCLLPAQQIPGQLFLGFGAEEIEPGTFLEYFESDPRVEETAAWITVTLRGVRGPGEFSVWSTDPFGTPTAWMSTFDGGVTDTDAVFLLEGGHSHFNFGFTEPGLYEVDLQASAFLPDGTPTISDVATYHFGVKTVPEPGALTLAGVAGVSLAVLLRRRNAS